MDQLDLSDFFQTKAQANNFSSHLAAVSEKIYETNFDLEKSLQDQFGILRKDKILSFLRENNIPVGSSSALKEIFTKIQQQIELLPVISLTMAIEPDEQIIKALSNWLLLNIKKQVLFDISIDPYLIAGTAIKYGGKYVDCTLKPVFDKAIKDALVNKIENQKTQVTQPNEYPKIIITP